MGESQDPRPSLAEAQWSDLYQAIWKVVKMHIPSSLYVKILIFLHVFYSLHLKMLIFQNKPKESQ